MSASTIDTTPADAPAGGHYTSTRRTTVRFSTRHLLGLGAVAGTARLQEADFSVTEPRSATVHAVLDAASFETGNARRDSDVRSAKYLDVTAYPDITFDSQLVRQHEEVGGGRDAHGPRRPRVDLTLEELRYGDAGVDLAGSAEVDRYAHQIAGQGLAARWLTVEVTAIARRDRIACRCNQDQGRR